MGCFGLATSNFSAMAMENMGAIAGTASSVQGFTTVTIGALIGAGIGQAFDGTTVPMFLGFFVAGLIALAIVALVERGRLFRPTRPSFPPSGERRVGNACLSTWRSRWSPCL